MKVEKLAWEFFEKNPPSFSWGSGQDGEYGPLSGARVRYARDGVEQENGFPIDLHKGAFVATVPIQEAGLEEELQKIGPEIARIVYEDLAESRGTLGMPSFADQG